MAGSFRIAEGYVEVTADQSSYDRSMERLKSDRHIVKVGVQLDEGDVLARLDRLARDRLATIKLRLDDTALSKLKLDNITVSVLPKINDAAYQRVVKQLDKLTADRVVRINASADTRVAADEIRNLTRRQRVRIGIDVDTRVAADDLANLTRTRTARINADLRTGDARTRLDALARDRRVNLDVNVRGGGASALSSLGGSGGGLSVLSGKIAQIAAAALGALPTLASLGESLVQMGPLAAVAVPAVLSLGAAFAAIKIGTSGVSDAIKAAFAPATSSGSAATSSLRAVQNAEEALAKAAQGVKDAEVNAAAARVKAARDVADAQQNLKNTVQSVADSNHQAAESVAAAERDLTNAQKAATQAQEDLTQARKDAAAELQDLSNQLADSQLSQRQDVLDLQDAEQNLAAVKAKGAAATQEEIDKAQLAYDQAVQQLAEQTLQTQRLQDQNDTATKAGVEGSSQVVAAKQGIADANQTVADQTQSLSDAQTSANRTAADGAQQIAKAERDLSDARAAQTKAATDGARSIADANMAVADAARALADAQNSGAAATSKTADALAKLSPNARAFVAAIVSLKGAWTALRLDVQDRLFAGLGSSFSTMATAALPSLRTGLVGTAGILNTMAKNALSAVTNLAKTGTLRQMFAGLNDGLRPLARFPGQFITALAQISVAASPAFKRLTTAAGNGADSISKKISKAFSSGGMTDAINGALDIAKEFGHLIGDIFGTISNVMKSASAGGGDALGMLGAVFKELRKVTAMPEVQKAMTSIFTAINKIATLLAGTLGVALGQLIIGIAPVADAITQMLSSLGNTGPLIGGLIAAFNPFLGILVLIAPLIGQLAKPLVGLVMALAPILSALSEFASGLFTALAPVLGALIDVLSAVLKSIAPIFAKVAPILLTVVKAIAGPLADVMAAMIPMIGPLIGIMTALDMAMLPLLPSILQLLPPVAQLAVALANLTVAVLTPLLPIVTALAAVLAGALSLALAVLIPVITTLIGWITALANALASAITGMVGALTSFAAKTKQIFTALASDVSKIWSGLWSKARSVWASFWSSLSSAIGTARGWIGTAFNGIRTTVSNAWSLLWNGVSSKFTTVISGVRTAIGSFASSTRTVFGTLRDALGTIWNGVRDKFAAPIRFVVGTVYNNGIRKMWDTIASKVGLPQLPSIKLGFARGGIIPGAGTKDDVPIWATPGERVLSRKQVAKLGGHAAIDAMVGRTDNHGPHYSVGGTIGNIASSVGGAVSGAVGSAVDWTKNIALGSLQSVAKTAISAVVTPLINRIPGGGTALGDLTRAIPKSILDGILSVLGKKDKDAATSGGVGGQISYKAGAGVAQWAPQILQALGMLGQSASWLGTVQRRMNQESGGNPNVVNKWDSNWTAGTPSVGLMQVIGPTFKSNAGPFGGTGPFSYGTSVNPLANTYAGLRYAMHRYGSLSALNRPGGYDSGGLLQPGATMAVNRTGRPERVLNADQTAKVDAMLGNAAHIGGAAGVTVNMTVNSLTMPTPPERRAWATAMAKDISEALRKRDRSLA